MLMNLAQRPDHATQVSEVLAELERLHDPEELFGLRTHLDILLRDADAAVHHAAEWAEADVLNPFAAALAVYLLCDLAARYEEAARLGVAAVRRSPANELLANNTAYALSLAGRPEEAKRLLAKFRGEVKSNVALTATLALAEIVSGNEEAGLAGYERARVLTPIIH